MADNTPNTTEQAGPDCQVKTRSARRSSRIVTAAVLGVVVALVVVVVAARATGERAGMTTETPVDFPVVFSCGATSFRINSGTASWGVAKVQANLANQSNVVAACGFGTRWQNNGWGKLKSLWSNGGGGNLALRVAENLKCRVTFNGAGEGYFLDCVPVDSGNELHVLKIG